MKCTIEGWHQPQGAGYGWAPCSDKKAERFFVFHRGNRCGPRDFKTRKEAKEYILKQEADSGKR